MESRKYTPSEALRWASTNKLSLVMAFAMFCATLSCSADQRPFNDPDRSRGPHSTLGIRG